MIPLDEERVDADDEPSTAAAAQHLRFLRGTILFMSALIVLLVVAIIAMAVHLPSRSVARRTENLFFRWRDATLRNVHFTKRYVTFPSIQCLSCPMWRDNNR